MGEFQQYQFKTVDRALSPEQKKYVDSLSSRGYVTSTSASFVYHYSDFRGDVKKLMTEYFDAMFYVTNWGTKQLMFRFPLSLVDEKAIRGYARSSKWGSYDLTFSKSKGYLIMDFNCNEEEGGGWIEEEDYELGDLLALREQIINGDYRMLYLAWLKIAEIGNLEDEDEYDEDDEYYEDESVSNTSPLVPPGLKKLSGALSTFVEYFEVDEDLISAAAANAPDLKKANIDYSALLKKLTQKEKEDYLLKLLSGEPRLDLKLKKHLESFVKTKKDSRIASPNFKQLAGESSEHEKIRLEKERKAAEEAHAKRMKEIEKDKKALWKVVFYNLERRTGKSYDTGTAVLKDLHDSALFHNNKSGFTRRMKKVLEGYGGSKALMRRFEEVGLA